MMRYESEIIDTITLAVMALTVVATKATETLSEKLDEGAITAVQNLFAVLKVRSPDTPWQGVSGITAF